MQIVFPYYPCNAKQNWANKLCTTDWPVAEEDGGEWKDELRDVDERAVDGPGPFPLLRPLLCAVELQFCHLDFGGVLNIII